MTEHAEQRSTVRYEFLMHGTISDTALSAFPELTAAKGAAGGTVLFGAVYEEFYAASYERRTKRLEAARHVLSFREAVRFVVSDLVMRTREHAPFLRADWTAGRLTSPTLRKRIWRSSSVMG